MNKLCVCAIGFVLLSSCAHTGRAKLIELAPHDSQEALLDALISDFLTRKEFEDTRAFYGTPGDLELVLVNTDYSVPWPASYGSKMLEGWRIIPAQQYDAPKPGQRGRLDRKIGVRIDLLCINSAVLDSERRMPFFGPISLCVFNAGGDRNGAVIGGCDCNYSAQLRDGKWTVTFAGLFDP